MTDSMNSTPVSSRIHISIFGRRNAGKSSIINALTNQPVALVSDVPGTTTDPVSKTMEILPLGPVVIIDTAGIDDVGTLGQMRVEKTYQVLNKSDLAILVIDGNIGVTDFELDILKRIKEKKINVVGVVNKIDTASVSEDDLAKWEEMLSLKLVKLSALTRSGVDELKRAVINAAPNDEKEPSLVGDIIKENDFAVLVVPIDSAAPKGRLILPQQQVIREVLDNNAIAVVTKEHQLKQTLKDIGKKPAMVITDSQAFEKVSAETPADIPLTSFSLLMARYKGDLDELVRGAKAVDSLKPGDSVLIAEACTHHRQADDIGTVKIPRWLNKAVGGELKYEWFSGMGFPEDIKKYKLIIHCGACMINRREMLYRISVAREQGVPIVNYGVLIAHLNGILPRTLEPLNKKEDQ